MTWPGQLPSPSGRRARAGPLSSRCPGRGPQGYGSLGRGSIRRHGHNRLGSSGERQYWDVLSPSSGEPGRLAGRHAWHPGPSSTVLVVLFGCPGSQPEPTPTEPAPEPLQARLLAARLQQQPVVATSITIGPLNPQICPTAARRRRLPKMCVWSPCCTPVPPTGARIRRPAGRFCCSVLSGRRTPNARRLRCSSRDAPTTSR